MTIRPTPTTSAWRIDGDAVLKEAVQRIGQTARRDFLRRSLTLGGLHNLKVGDIIPITIPETVTASVDGIDVLQCKYGVQNGHYALRIERFMAGEEELIEHALNAQGKKTGEEKP